MPKSLPDFDSAWDHSDPAGTEERLLEWLPEIEARADPDTHAQLLTQIARTHSLRGRFNEAHALLDEADAMLTDGATTGRVRSLLERGRTYNSAGDAGRATELFKQAFERADSLGLEVHAADALHMLGISTPPQQAQSWNQRAIEYCENCTDEQARRWLGPLYHNTWFTYLQQGQYETALVWAKKSRAFRESVEDVRGERIGRWALYHTLRKLGRIAEALAGQQALLVEHEQAGGTDGYCHEEIAECLSALGRPMEARPHFAAAFEELKGERWIQESDPDRLKRLERLGRD